MIFQGILRFVKGSYNPQPAGLCNIKRLRLLVPARLPNQPHEGLTRLTQEIKG